MSSFQVYPGLKNKQHIQELCLPLIAESQIVILCTSHYWKKVIRLLSLSIFPLLSLSLFPNNSVAPTSLLFFLSLLPLFLPLLPSRRFESHLVVDSILRNFKSPTAEDPRPLGDWHDHPAAPGGPDTQQLLDVLQAHGGVLQRNQHVADSVDWVKKV